MHLKNCSIFATLLKPEEEIDRSNLLSFLQRDWWMWSHSTVYDGDACVKTIQVSQVLYFVENIIWSSQVYSTTVLSF